MGIDPDDEHLNLLDRLPDGNAAAGNPEEIECSVLFRATPQPRSGRWSVRSKANQRWQGILETTHRTSRRYEQHPRVRIRSSFRAIWRASADEPTVKYGRPWLCERCLFLVALALVTVSLSTLSRTAAAKTVSPGTYMSRLCTVVDDWAHNIEAAGQNVDAALAGVTSLDAAKKVLMTAEQRLLADTDQAVKALQRAGAPRVPNGKKVASRGLAGMTLVRQSFERQVREAAAVPTDDVTAFQTAVQNISSNADPAITKLTELFNSVGRLDTSGKLSHEVTHQRACITLSNGSATTTT